MVLPEKAIISIAVIVLIASLAFYIKPARNKKRFKKIIGIRTARVGKGGIKKHSLGTAIWKGREYKARLAAGARLQEIRAGRKVRVVEMAEDIIIVKPITRKK